MNEFTCGRICPRCGKEGITGRAAISRWGKIEVCHDCGADEAGIEVDHGTYRCDAECVHPIRGQVRWVHIPPWAEEESAP